MAAKPVPFQHRPGERRHRDRRRRPASLRRSTIRAAPGPGREATSGRSLRGTRSARRPVTEENEPPAHPARARSPPSASRRYRRCRRQGPVAASAVRALPLRGRPQARPASLAEASRPPHGAGSPRIQPAVEAHRLHGDLEGRRRPPRGRHPDAAACTWRRTDGSDDLTERRVCATRRAPAETTCSRERASGLSDARTTRSTAPIPTCSGGSDGAQHGRRTATRLATVERQASTEVGIRGRAARSSRLVRLPELSVGSSRRPRRPARRRPGASRARGRACAGPERIRELLPKLAPRLRGSLRAMRGLGRRRAARPAAPRGRRTRRRRPWGAVGADRHRAAVWAAAIPSGSSTRRRAV